MRAVLRLGVAFWVAGLALTPAPALAQDAEATTNAPATDAVGPRELEGFSLQGTVTRSADPPAAAAPPARTPPATPPAAERDTATPVSASRPAERRQAETSASPRAPAATAPRSATERQLASGASTVTVNLPPVGSSLTPAAASDSGFALDDQPALPPEPGFSLWPWLLAAMALGAGGAFLLWRRNHREAIAGGPRIDAFVAPQPQPRGPTARTPASAPVPAPKPAPEPPPPGIVSTRLRPWIDLAFEPLRCIVDDERVTFEFELAMRNSGSAPARDVLIEASTFNAGPSQDQEIQAFFDSPVGEGERIAAIPPLKSFNLRTQLSVARDQVRVLEAGGRHVFVPLIAFNAMYRWGTGDGQTSAAYLIGRDTKGEKMAPFRLDLGARVFRGVAQRPLPVGVRR
jgi:hypothetical protein